MTRASSRPFSGFKLSLFSIDWESSVLESELLSRSLYCLRIPFSPVESFIYSSASLLLLSICFLLSLDPHAIFRVHSTYSDHTSPVLLRVRCWINSAVSLFCEMVTQDDLPPFFKRCLIPSLRLPFTPAT